jgi:hypothetical protein
MNALGNFNHPVDVENFTKSCKVWHGEGSDNSYLPVAKENNCS